MIGRGLGRKRDKHETPVWSIAFRPPDTKVQFQARVPSASEGMGFEASFEVNIAWNGAGTAAQARARALLQREVIRIAKKVSSGTGGALRPRSPALWPRRREPMRRWCVRSPS